MPVNYIDRYKVRPEDWEAAERWAHDATWHLGYLYEKKISSITIYSSDELWIGGKETEMGWKEDMELNPDVLTLEFVLGDHWKGEPYLQRISYDVGRVSGLSVPSQVDWRVSDGDPPSSLEELLEREPKLSERARQFPAFFELYTGIYDRIFPHVEREHVYTDVGPYDEGRKLPATHLKKEIWRTDLLTALQGLRFPPMEVEGEGAKVRVVWEPQGHTNYMIWFNLNSGEDPKLCAYCDPTYSGSTTGWLSTRLLKNEAALAKLPYTIEQWVVEDLRGKEHAGPDYRQWRQNIRELLRHRIPRELEEAWGAIRRQLVHVEREDIHTDTGGYEESRKRLTEFEEAFRFDPQNFPKVVEWAETTEGMVKAYIDEYSRSKEYVIRFNSGGGAGAKIIVPGKGGRKYAFHFTLTLEIEVVNEGSINQLGVTGNRLNYQAHVVHGTEYIGSAHAPYANMVLYPTLKEVRNSLGMYGPVGGVTDRSKLYYYSNIAYQKGVKDTGKFLFQKLDNLYQEAVGRLEPPVEREEVHTDTGYEESVRARDESLIKKLKETGEEEERYYGIATGDGNSGISHSFPDYIVLTDKPWQLAELAAYATFKDDPVIQEWVKKNMDIDGDANYGITVAFPESMEFQQEREAAYEEYEKRREEAETAGEEFEEDDPSEEYMESTWFMIDIFPMDASEVDRRSCDVYDSTDHPDWMDSLFPLVQPEDIHTDVGPYEESLTAKEADFRLLKTREEIERLKPGDRVYLIINPGKDVEEFFSAKVVNVLPGEGMVKIYVDDPRCDWGHAEDRTRVYSANTYLYVEDVPVEREEIFTDTGSYEEAFLRHLPEQFRLKG